MGLKPLLPAANEQFGRGDFAAALASYRACLGAVAASAAPSPSLMAFCEARIVACEQRLHIVRGHAVEHGVMGRFHEERFFDPGDFSELPKVSVLIPHHRSARLLAQALDSIRDQAMREIETLIVDDASPDDAPSSHQLGRYPAWMRLRLIRLERNAGPSRCRNLAAERSQGRALCLLDADDYLDAEALSARWELLNRDPSVAAAFCRMAYVDADRQPLGNVILGNLQSLSFTDFTSNKFPCSALMFRRRALLQDPFDGALSYGEDYDCFSRIAQRGGLFRLAETGTVFYRQHGSSLTHKDAAADIRSRIAITQSVHARRLPWALVGCTQDLPSAIAAREIALRAFPVACVYALRGDTERAREIAALIDADAVATQTARQAAGTLKFFLTREEFLPEKALPALLERLDRGGLLAFVDGFFRARHGLFVGAFLDSLYGAPLKDAAEALPSVCGAPIHTMHWADFLRSPWPEDLGFVALLHAGETWLPDAKQRTRRVLAARADLEGLWAYRVHARGHEVLTDLDTIAPASPDSTAVVSLGERLRPVPVLIEPAARALRQWLLGAGLSAEDAPETVERSALAAIGQLRLKLIGGVADAFVLCAEPANRTAPA